jgi:hypothetical protein
MDTTNVTQHSPGNAHEAPDGTAAAVMLQPLYELARPRVNQSVIFVLPS